MEITCLVALVIVFIADVLEIFTVRRFFAFSRSISGTFTYESWKNLDPEYLKEVFENRVKMSTMAGVTSIMSALSIFALIIPILQVSWILSQGGKRHVGLHVAVCVLALACGFTELITSLMLIGARNAFVFIVEMFDLDDWQLQRSDDESGSGGDGTGYRVLELIDIVVNGMATWLDAFEWVSTFAIMTILFFLVRSERNSGKVTFGKKWTYLGLAIGCIGLFEFLASVLRLSSWVFYSKVSFVILIINTLILLPIWLFVLGRQLPAVRASFENQWVESETEYLRQPTTESLSQTQGPVATSDVL